MACSGWPRTLPPPAALVSPTGTLEVVRDEGLTVLGAPETGKSGLLAPRTEPTDLFLTTTTRVMSFAGFSAWGAYNGPIGPGGGWFFGRVTLSGLTPSHQYIIRTLSGTFPAFEPHGVRLGTATTATENELTGAVYVAIGNDSGASPIYTDTLFTSNGSGVIYMDVGAFDLEVGSAIVVYLDGLWVYDPALPPGPDDPGGLPGELEVLLFTPEINWEQPFAEELEFETTVTLTYAQQEQREAIMDTPNRRFSFLLSTLEARESGLLETLVLAGQTRTWWVPYWRSAEWLPISRIAGQTTLAFDTRFKGYEIGQGIMFWRDPYTAEVAIITAITNGLLTFSALTQNWSAASGALKTRIIPAFESFLSPTVDLDYLERSIKQATVSFDLVGPC